ncbi:hypothetical protein KQX54_020517 [Cotesia glomerata]|uniref:Uncharacterized protein n=1 Tax=Cotesia glomerata TaxID=32391 RepID=A0AAV7IU72_COTGL|nr:hypothetical protein KQX54_020517 [Cotesia glomerata]
MNRSIESFITSEGLLFANNFQRSLSQDEVVSFENYSSCRTLFLRVSPRLSSSVSFRLVLHRPKVDRHKTPEMMRSFIFLSKRSTGFGCPSISEDATTASQQSDTTMPWSIGTRTEPKLCALGARKSGWTFVAVTAYIISKAFSLLIAFILRLCQLRATDSQTICNHLGLTIPEEDLRLSVVKLKSKHTKVAQQASGGLITRTYPGAANTTVQYYYIEKDKR